MPEAPASGHEVAFTAALDGLVLHIKGNIVEANPSATRLLGASAGDLLGQSFLDFVVIEGRAQVRDGLRDGLNEPLRTHLLAGGRRVAVMIGITPAGESPGCISIRDLSLTRAHGRQHEREKARDAELARLEQMNQFKTQLLNTAAHELNTPLTPLRLQVHLLASKNLGDLSDRQLKAVKVLERNVERLSLLVSDILDVARLESGHLAVELRDVDLDELIEESAQSYEETARGIGVKLQVKSSTGIICKADARRILQVLYNLVSNGIKFTPEGGTVTLATHVEDNQAVIEIRDTGLGMDAKQIGALFHPFSRVHDTESTAIPGTGLGLYISKGIVEQHAGRLTVASKGPGKGTTFRFTLPLATAGHASAPAEPTKKTPMVAGPLAQRLRELI